jgi:uncharacterized peroxidase-related enzyme
MQFRPETATPINHLVEVLLRSDDSLTRGQRELIASYVSCLNDCHYCTTSHGAYAARQLEGGYDVVDGVRSDLDSAPVDERMRALLRIAAKVQEGGKCVTDEDVTAARAQGATDLDIHDTVLIAAVFCMCNRYVDGLATWAPTDQESYEGRADMIVEHGYMALNASLAAGSDAPS